MTDKGLRIVPFTSNINEVKPTSTLFYRQQHNQFTAAATMEYKPKNEKDFAGNNNVIKMKDISLKFVPTP